MKYRPPKQRSDQARQAQAAKYMFNQPYDAGQFLQPENPASQQRAYSPIASIIPPQQFVAEQQEN